MLQAKGQLVKDLFRKVYSFLARTQPYLVKV